MNHPPQTARRSSRTHRAQGREEGWESRSSVGVMAVIRSSEAPYCSTKKKEEAGGTPAVPGGATIYWGDSIIKEILSVPLEVRSMRRTLLGCLALLVTALPAAAGNLYVPLLDRDGVGSSHQRTEVWIANPASQPRNFKPTFL